MSLITPDIQEYIDLAITEVVKSIPPESWHFSVGRKGDPFGQSFPFSLLYETEAGEQNENPSESFHVVGFIEALSTHAFRVKKSKAGYRYKQIVEKGISSELKGSFEDTDILDNILEFNPEFIAFCKEYREGVSLGKYDYIFSYLQEENSKWEISYEELFDAKIPAVIFDVTIDNDIKVRGCVLDEFDDYKKIKDMKKPLVILKKGEIFKLKYFIEDFEEEAFHIALHIALIKQVEEGRANQEFYDGKLPSWIGDVSQFASKKNEHEIPTKDFLVRITKPYCVKEEHPLESIKAIVKVMNSNGITSVVADAMYCPTCNEYYITDNEYDRVCRRGTLCHKVVTETEYIKLRNNYNSWGEKSILSCYGYSANSQDDLSEEHRHRIIDFVITEGIMKTDEVISFLEWLVRDRGHRYPIAQEKWKNDATYVRQKKKTDRTVEVGDIYRKDRRLPF